MKQDIADEALESKWQELNLGIDQWKHKYLYPFGQILPIESKANLSTEASVMRSNVSQQQRSVISNDPDLFNLSKQ
jgi:hypothetical protein